MIRAEIDWTAERIEQEIRATFPEDPITAVAVAKCESGLVLNIQSHHITSAGYQEPSFGIFQIHSPSWHERAVALGYANYRTDPADNIKMARYIYDSRGSFRDWTCYTKGLYRNQL